MSQFHNVQLFEESEEKSGKIINNDSGKSNSKKIETKDIIIQIRDQETIAENIIKFIIEVNIKTNNHFWLDKVNEKTWTVGRRYSEFDILRMELVKRYPACLIPPLPSKVNFFNPKIVVNQKKDNDFIDIRRQRLEMFLNRLLAHPKLRGEVLIFDFLHNGENWIDLFGKKEFSEKIGNVINWRWINVQSQLINLIDNNVNVSYLNELIKSNSISEECMRLIERGRHIQDSLKNLINCLTKVDEQTSLLHHLYKNYGEAFFDWCATEQAIGDTLQSFGHICDTYSTLTDSPTPVGKPVVLPQPGSNIDGVFSILSWNEICLLLQELYDFGECWIELAGRWVLLNKKLKRQMANTLNKEEQLERLKNGLPLKSGTISSLTSKFKKPISESEVDRMQSELEEFLVNDRDYLDSLQASKQLFDHCVNEEVEYFDKLRARDMHIVMYSYACNQLGYSERCLRLWQRARQSLD